MRHNTFILALILSFFTFSLSGQLSPEEAVAGMGRGINLGNTLEPPTEGAWNNGPARESHFDAYIEAGFTNVRIPVRWDQHTSDDAPYTINSSWMNRVEQVVDWGLSRGLFITLNGHHEDWLKNNYNNANLRARYDAIWVQIAERFKDKSDKLLFEIINEPKGMTRAQVDELNERILGIIRVENPTRIVIYGGNEWANSDELLAAKIPTDDYLVGYYHAYDPWQFSGLGTGTWGSNNDYLQLTNKYKSVKTWSTTNGIPVHHSEFGAVLACDFNSRMRIYAHNVEQCIVNGFAFSVWDDGGNFGVLNRSNDSWPEVKDILMHYHEDSPNRILTASTADPVTNEPMVKVEWNNRATDNGNIIIERIGSNGFEQIAELASDATSYIDSDVASGKTYTYRMYTTRMDGTLLHGYPSRVRITSTFQSPYNSMPIAIPGILEVEEYDNGGEGLAYHDNDAANVSGNFRPGEGVDIGAFGGGHILGYVESGEWLEYTVDVTQTGLYTIKADVASEIANGTFSITSDKNQATSSFLSPNTNGWVQFQEITADDEIQLESGIQQIRLDITNSNAFNLDRLTFELISTDVNEIETANFGLKLSPNPTDGFVTIEINAELKAPITQVHLLTLTGQKVATFNIERSTSILDLSSYESGVYLLQLVNGSITAAERMVIR